jgi:hypothetical protein
MDTHTAEAMQNQHATSPRAQRIEDAGEKLGGARKDEQTPEQKPREDETQVKLIDTLWPAPQEWRDLLSSMEPQRAVLQMILRGRVAANPHHDGYHGKARSFWQTHYLTNINALYRIVNDPDIPPDIDSVRAAFHKAIDFNPKNDDKQELLRLLSIGRAHKKTLKNPFGLTLNEQMRMRYLVKMGWDTNESIPDGHTYNAAEMTDKSGARFWMTTRIEGDSFYFLSKTKHATEQEAAKEAIQLTQLHCTEEYKEQKKEKPWKWSRPSIEAEPVRILHGHPASEGRTAEEIIARFGIRGIEFGNWIPQGERQAIIDQCYDALCDLVMVLKMPDRIASLGGKLGLGFGSRGAGLSNHAAHFEPGNWIIHLTRKSGAGSLAHEYAHALDHFIAVRSKKKKPDFYEQYASQAATSYEKSHFREDDMPIFDSLGKWASKNLNGPSLNGSNFMRDAWRMDRKRTAGKMDYWGSREEMFARCFEAYIHDALKAVGARNDYLVYGVDQELQQQRKALKLPTIYPVEQERDDYMALMGDFITACRTAWGVQAKAA